MRKMYFLILFFYLFCNIFFVLKAQETTKIDSFATEKIRKIPNYKIVESDINGKTVSFSKFIKALTKQYFDTTDNEKYQLLLKDITLKFDEVEDRAFMDKRFSENNAPLMYCVHDIGIEKVNIDGGMWWVMNRFVFKGYVTISQFSNAHIWFKNCIFEKTVRFATCNLVFLNFENCEFQHGFRYHLNTLKDYAKFQNCKISINPNIQNDTRMSPFDMYVIEAHLFEFNQKGEAIDFTMHNCTFDVPKRNKNFLKYSVNISETHFTNLQLVDNTFNTNLNLAQATVENQFLYTGGKLNGAMIIDALNINPLNTRVQWTNFANNKISIYDAKKQLVSGKQRKEIKDEVVFSNLISCYATFYGLFKAQGNRTYGNSCYVEWKNIETEYLYNLYQKDTRVSVFFAYLMNVFLRDFCDYGTNPLKSIYLSSIVLLVFAVVYFISPFQLNGNKDEDGKYTQNSIYTQLRLYASYFLEKEKLKNIYLRNQVCKIENNDYQEFIRLTNGKMGRLPLMFHLIAKPTIWWRSYKHTWEVWFYERIDFVHDKWEELGKSRRFLISFVFGVFIVLGFIYFVFVRAVDAFTLSLNVFSTLGFGEIPVKGVIRYMTVIEGFIGWFLLSIFSVSLISQVIQ